MKLIGIFSILDGAGPSMVIIANPTKPRSYVCPQYAKSETPKQMYSHMLKCSKERGFSNPSQLNSVLVA
jgi:hypothetical protein